MSNSPFHPFFGYNRGYDPDMDQVALFIDWDNLVISNYADRGVNRPDLEIIVRKAQQYGTLVMARAYAEWQVLVDRLEVYKAGVEPIYAPVFHSGNDLSGQMGRGKSLADPIMVTDCIDFLHLLPQVGTYVLVTGDKDMMPVVRLAKMRGRRVIVIGPDYVANVLQQVSDEFVPYRTLLAQGAYEQYAAYGYNPNQAYPQVGANQLPVQGFQPYNNFGAQPQSQSQGSNERDRRGRRLSSSSRDGRRSGSQSSYTPQSQLYNQVQMPPSSYGQQQQPFNGYTPQAGYQQPAYGQPLPPQTGQIPQSYGYDQYGNQQPAYNQGQAYTQPSQYGQPAYGAPVPNQPATSAYQPYQETQPPVVPIPSYQQPIYAPVPIEETTLKTPTNPAAYPSTAPVTPTSAPVAATSNEMPRGRSAADFEQIKELIRNILSKEIASGRPQLRARDLKEEILHLLPNFSERRYGFSKFKAFLSAVEQAGVIQTEQADHIVWVSLPGTAKLPANVTSDADRQGSAATAVNLTDEDEGEENESLDQNTSFEGATQAETDQKLELKSSSASNDAAVATESTSADNRRSDQTISLPSRVAEERTTTLAEAPIGAHREPRNAQAAPSSQSSKEEVAVTGNTGPTYPELGPKPALLEQPFYQDVIVLIDNLRYRNRWLGYELLLSNVRDYLSKQMSESEAKSQAGTILSRLLSEGVLKPSQEIHSRGARKMRVLVQHLQEDNRAVKYALAAAKIGDQQRKAQAAAQQAASESEAQADLQETATRKSRIHRLVLTTSSTEETEQPVVVVEASTSAEPEAQFKPDGEAVSNFEAVVSESSALQNDAEMPSSMLPTGVIGGEQSEAEGTAPENSDQSNSEVAQVIKTPEYQPDLEASVQPSIEEQVGQSQDNPSGENNAAEASVQPSSEEQGSNTEPLTQMQSHDFIPGIDFENRVESVETVREELTQRAIENITEGEGEQGLVQPEIVTEVLIETVGQPNIEAVSNEPSENSVVDMIEASEEHNRESEEGEVDDGEQVSATGEVHPAPIRRRTRRPSTTVHKIVNEDEQV